MNVITTKEYVLSIENRPGAVAEIAIALGKAGINVTGFCCEAQGEFGVLRIVTSDALATEAWLKTTRYLYHGNEVLLANAPNHPGELGRFAQKLAASGVNILACYANLVPTGPQLVFAVNDVPSAKKILG